MGPIVGSNIPSSGIEIVHLSASNSPVTAASNPNDLPSIGSDLHILVEYFVPGACHHCGGRRSVVVGCVHDRVHGVGCVPFDPEGFVHVGGDRYGGDRFVVAMFQRWIFRELDHDDP